MLYRNALDIQCKYMALHLEFYITMYFNLKIKKITHLRTPVGNN